MMDFSPLLLDIKIMAVQSTIQKTRIFLSLYFLKQLIIHIDASGKVIIYAISQADNNPLGPIN